MNRRGQGFTLIEVLVALAIVAFGMAAVLAAMTSAADNAFYMRDKTLAEWVALNQIATVRLKDTMPSKGKTEGTVDDFAGRRWAWMQDVQQLQIPGMFRLDVSVRPLKQGESAEGGSTQRSWYATASGIVGDAVERGWSDPEFWAPTPTGSGGGGKTTTTGGTTEGGSTTDTTSDEEQSQ